MNKAKFNTNDELYNHVLFEFIMHSARVPMNEEHGYVADANRFVVEFMPEVEKQISATCGQNGTLKHTYDGVFNGGFFSDYEITIRTTLANSRYSGSFSPFESISETNGEIICKPIISVTVAGNNATILYRNIAFAIGHELTHAYNAFKYAKTYGLNALRKNITQGQGYAGIKEYSEGYYSQLTQAAAAVLYFLNRMERNAYIAQLKQELAGEHEWIKDSKSAMEAIKATKSYEKFLYLERNVEAILNMKDEGSKETLLFATNKIIRNNGQKPFNNFEQLKKYYANVWYKWKQKYLIVASKIAYDIYAENNLEMDGGIMNKETNLKK